MDSSVSVQLRELKAENLLNLCVVVSQTGDGGGERECEGGPILNGTMIRVNTDSGQLRSSDLQNESQ